MPNSHAAPLLGRELEGTQLRLSLNEAVLPEAPDQLVEAILAKEGLAGEDHRRHPPMSRGSQSSIVVCETRVVLIRLVEYRCFKLIKIEAGSGGGISKMTSLVPSADPTVPKKSRHLTCKLEASAALVGRDAQPAEPVRERLFGRDRKRRRVLRDGIRNRPPEGHPVKGRTPGAVHHEVGPGKRVHPGKVAGVADGGRMHDPKIDRDVVAPLQLKYPGQNDVGVGAAKRPVELNRQNHTSLASLSRCQLGREDQNTTADLGLERGASPY